MLASLRGRVDDPCCGSGGCFVQGGAFVRAGARHEDRRADCVMANPSSNMRDWKDGPRDAAARWKHGIPPQGSANSSCARDVSASARPDPAGGAASTAAARPTTRAR